MAPTGIFIGRQRKKAARNSGQKTGPQRAPFPAVRTSIVMMVVVVVVMMVMVVPTVRH